MAAAAAAAATEATTAVDWTGMEAAAAADIHAYTFLIKLPRWPFALRPFGGARSAKAPPGCRGGTAFPRAALPSAPEMDLDSDSDRSKPDMRDDIVGSDRHWSSNAQGSSLGAERMGMQVRSSSSEDGISPP